MGNSQGRESRPGSSRGQPQSSSGRMPGAYAASQPTEASGPSRQDTSQNPVYAFRSGRGSRPDLSTFLGIGGNSERDPALEPRRETKAEREARKLEKERILRAQQRERSIREESVDGGYLVTLGTYTGPEDFSKPVVRQLQIERRLAPFWKGLNDHSDTWTEHQLTAVVNDLPLPAPDEIPPDEPSPTTNLSADWSPRGSSANINNLTVPISSRSLSQGSDRSANLSPSHPAFSLPSPSSPIAAGTSSSSSPFFRGRAKTLAALTTGSRSSSQTEMVQQEMMLPKDPYINGQRIEVFLYKDAAECPICFLYYPPYLNKTRCCDQPICSECFVQIKRPDPHPPEHHDPNNPTAESSEPADDVQLVSEPASCPFCVQPDFGVTYEPPPFRRGLVYPNQHNRVASATSAMSSSTSLNSQGNPPTGRRRATSLAANDSSVITTDRVRPDWSKKLADARALALRKAAAATALHNAAYMMGNLEASGSRGFGLGRRRRTMFTSDSAGSSGQGTPRREGEGSGLPSTNRVEGSSDLFPGRQSSRRANRLEDLEELMMMEAIRLSLAEEEERKRKEEKEAAKEAKKDEKKKAKEAKKAEKASRKSAVFPHTLKPTEGGESPSAGKGKAVDRSGGSAGFNPLSEPTSTVNESLSKTNPQRHLEQSRAQIQRETSSTDSVPPADPYDEPSSHRAALRNLSSASSSASSLAESPQGSLLRVARGDGRAADSSENLSPNASGVSLSVGQDESLPSGTPGTEPMFNFRSLEAMMTKDRDSKDTGEVFENAGSSPPPGVELNRPVGADSTSAAHGIAEQAPTTGLEESVMTLRPARDSADAIEPVSPEVQVISDDNRSSLDTKHIGDVTLVDSGEQATQ
ncbi:hypothetical protein M011DRAFT_422123 [Sporormia fimetaria CBS 119925]|uniref:Protein sip5 n=1 Tax=Sporormia fimetaria CBS 119925 TaxID=1340428 RepID=A0A6A6VEQ0_9PLEO|nr:hypothetical protein M011DRAFT_422123 [Sporormia fimetaria CBS 119925]